MYPVSVKTTTSRTISNRTVVKRRHSDEHSPWPNSSNVAWTTYRPSSNIWASMYYNVASKWESFDSLDGNILYWECIISSSSRLSWSYKLCGSSDSSRAFMWHGFLWLSGLIAIELEACAYFVRHRSNNSSHRWMDAFETQITWPKCSDANWFCSTKCCIKAGLLSTLKRRAFGIVHLYPFLFFRKYRNSWLVDLPNR